MANLDDLKQRSIGEIEFEDGIRVILEVRFRRREKVKAPRTRKKKEKEEREITKVLDKMSSEQLEEIRNLLKEKRK